MATPLYLAAGTLAATATPSKGGMQWWAVGLITFGAILGLAVVLTLMTLHERKRHPHA